jgi:hypothetical protein
MAARAPGAARLKKLQQKKLQQQKLQQQTAVKRSFYWESLEQALAGDTSSALTASQLQRGRRYYSEGGARAVRLDDDSVHLEHRGIGRAQSSGVLPLHQLTPSRAAPTRLANITNTATPRSQTSPASPATPATPGAADEDFAALASSRRVSFTPSGAAASPRETGATPPPLPPPIVPLPARQSPAPDSSALSRQLAQQEEACRVLRARLVTVERERSAEREQHDAALQTERTAQSRALQVLEASHADRLAAAVRRTDAVLWQSATDSIVQDTMAFALSAAVDDAVEGSAQASRVVVSDSSCQCNMSSEDEELMAAANGGLEWRLRLAQEQAERILDLESQLALSQRELAVAVATRDAIQDQSTQESVRSAALQEKLYSAELALEEREAQLSSERQQARSQRQQFKDGMAAAQKQMADLLQQHEARVSRNMNKMDAQVHSWQGRLTAAEAALCVVQAASTATEAAAEAARAEHAKSLAQLAAEHASELELAEIAAQASVAASARFAEVHAEKKVACAQEQHERALASLRGEIAEQRQTHELQCAVVGEATAEVVRALEAQHAHALAGQREMEESAAVRLAEVEAERGDAMRAAEQAEQAHAEAILALDAAAAAAQTAAAAARNDDDDSGVEGGCASPHKEEETESLRAELVAQRTAMAEGDVLLRSLAGQVEVLLQALSQQKQVQLESEEVAAVVAPELEVEPELEPEPEPEPEQQSQHEQEQELQPEPEPERTLERQRGRDEASLSPLDAGRERLRRCNAKFRALLEHKQHRQHRHQLQFDGERL